MNAAMCPDMNPGELPAAVVIGGKLNGLGVIRSLRGAGMSIAVIDSVRWAPAMWSRSCRRVVAQALHGQPLIDCLIRLRSFFATSPVLFVTDEMAVYSISDYRDVLAKSYRFRLPSREMVDALADKVRFHRLAEAGNFAVPRSLVIEQRSDLTRLAELSFPVVIKLADKQLMHRGLAKSVYSVDTLHHAEALASELFSIAGRLIVQERIPGPDSDIYFCLFYCGRDGTPVSLFTGRKIRSRPPRVGGTAICVAAPPAAHAELEPLTRRFIDYAGFFGMGGVEYKWHAAQRRFVIIEPTVGRTDWQEEIATLCGENIPLRAYSEEVGWPLAKPANRFRDVAWRETVATHWPTHLMGKPELIYDAYWRSNDPIPALAYYGGAWVPRAWRSLSFRERRLARCKVAAAAMSINMENS
jgi:predicted ATP-grasp superfamily ATP-dependent carboligase